MATEVHDTYDEDVIIINLIDHAIGKSMGDAPPRV